MREHRDRPHQPPQRPEAGEHRDEQQRRDRREQHGDARHVVAGRPRGPFAAPRARALVRAQPWQVGQRGVELAEVRRREHRIEAALELVGVQAARARVHAQCFGRPLAVGVAGPRRACGLVGRRGRRVRVAAAVVMAGVPCVAGVAHQRAPSP
jgi:hypothetical protein